MPKSEGMITSGRPSVAVTRAEEGIGPEMMVRAVESCQFGLLRVGDIARLWGGRTASCLKLDSRNPPVSRYPSVTISSLRVTLQ